MTEIIQQSGFKKQYWESLESYALSHKKIEMLKVFKAPKWNNTIIVITSLWLILGFLLGLLPMECFEMVLLNSW